MVLPLSRWSMNKIPCASQNMAAKTFLLMFASLATLDDFHLLLSTQLTADLFRCEVVDQCFIYCHIFMQKLLFVALKQLQIMLWLVNALLFSIKCEQTQPPLWTQLSYWQMFMQNGEYAAFWYLQLLCNLMQLQFTIGQNEFVEFLGVYWHNCWIWVTWAFNIICVCMNVLKVSIPPLNHCFQQSRVWITLIKPLLWLHSILSHQKAMLYQHMKFKFYHCFHHHDMQLARISLTLSLHVSLSFIAFGRSSGLHPVSSHSCCMNVRAGRPAFDWPYAGSTGANCNL